MSDRGWEAVAWRYRATPRDRWSLIRDEFEADALRAEGFEVETLYIPNGEQAAISPNAAREAQRIIEKAATDVRRMLTEHAAKGDHFAELVDLIGCDIASAEDKNVLFAFAEGKCGPITPEEARALAMKLGVPEDWNKKAPRS